MTHKGICKNEKEKLYSVFWQDSGGTCVEFKINRQKLMKNTKHISREQMENLRFWLKDMVSCSTKKHLWVAKMREEDIIVFLNGFMDKS